MNKQNYQKIMEQQIAEACLGGNVPRVLLHSCCGPCSTYCIQTLSEYFEVTVFYYNPNIYPEEEYHHRASEQERFIREFPTKHPVSFVEGSFHPQDFYDCVKGRESDHEGGEYCFKCYRLRLRETAEFAQKEGFDFFTTTLSVSPLKNAEKLNEIGAKLGEEYGVPYLHSDFKKKEGYKRSTEISAEYNMYRQYYCGCAFSKKERDEQIAAAATNEKPEA